MLARGAILPEPSAMMILRTSPPSPFGRKVLLAASLLGLSNEITIEKADPSDASDTLRRQNPVGKIPILILDDGTTLFDSRVILEYLDHRAGGGKIIPREPDARFAALRLQALPTAPPTLRYWCSTRAASGLRAARAEVARLPERKDPARLRRARGRTAADRSDSERRADRARLPARPPRPALQGRVARRPPEAGRLARPLRRAGAGVRRNQGRGVSSAVRAGAADLREMPSHSRLS